MSIDLDTTWLGDGDCSADQIVAAVMAAGRSAYPLDTVRAIAVAIVHWCDVFNLRPSAVAGQIMHETGWLQFDGDVRPEQNNYAGLGATGGVPGASFATVDDGVRAVLAHHLVYIYGPVENWPGHLREYRTLDSRYQAVIDAGYGGTVRTIGSYTNGRWAYSRDVPVGSLENGYARGIVRAANVILRQTSTEQEQAMRDPQAEWLPSSNLTHGRQGRRVRWIIIHTTEGGYAGALSWLRGAAGGSGNDGSSSHYLLDQNGGRLAQLVDEADTAWTAGNYDYNLQSVNIEMEGHAGRGGFTDGLYNAVGALVGRIAVRHGLELSRAVVIGHRDVPDQDHIDPGPHFDFDRLITIARGNTNPSSGDCLTFDAVPHRICHGFKAFWEKYGGLPIFGYPITDEMQEGGRTVQYFERARFEHHPGSSADMFDVMLGLIGTELLESRAAQD